MKRLIAFVLIICAFMTMFASAENDDGWVSFLLICNEGMKNDGGNSGNTMMAVALNTETGKIRLMVLSWDSFIRYEGYDVPQKIDMPYRNAGPSETLKVFNDNFGLNIELYMSLNYLNLSTLIDNYGGVTVPVTRAERNALNGMVASKKENIMLQADLGMLSQLLIELMAQDYYLDDFGPETHLNGLQAVGFGWLQYDSVYNCCMREMKVIGNLFTSVFNDISSKVLLYEGEGEYEYDASGRRVINLDNMTDDDMVFLRRLVSPIFEMSYNNLTDEAIDSITLALARTAYEAAKQGVVITDSLEHEVVPLEVLNEYDHVAGTTGHLVDYEANGEAMREFLYGDR